MIRKLQLLAGTLIVSIGSFAQSFHFIEGDNASLSCISNISSNGKWAFGARSGVGVSLYDIDNKTISFHEGAFADGISDDGILVGQDATLFAAYCKEGVWISLPSPKNERIYESVARSISADGTIIAGMLSYENSYRRPCIWTKQPNGEYSIEILPYEEIDFTGRTIQAVDALRCSADGQIIYGRSVDYTGFFCLVTYWKKDESQKWKYHTTGKELLFKEGAEIPSIPEDPKRPNPKTFYTAQDSLTFAQALEDYKNGLIPESPDWHPQNYITNPDSIAKYNKDAEYYNTQSAIINEKLDELYAASTGKELDVYSLNVSRNGRFVNLTSKYLNIETNDEHNYPICFDIETGKWIEKEFIKNAISMGVTDNGEIFYATTYDAAGMRTGFVTSNTAQEGTEFTEWVKQKTSGVLDIKPELLFTFEIYDRPTGQFINATDSLLTGDICPSADGNRILGYIQSPENHQFMAYIVELAPPSKMENISKEKEHIIYPNPVKDILYVNGIASNVTITDLSGRTLYSSNAPTQSVPVASLGKGTYLVRVTVNGQTTAHKVTIAQ